MTCSSSSTFVYDYKMSTGGGSARNSHLTQGGRTTTMTMPVNRITSQCKIKLSQKYCLWLNLQLWNFCHSFLQWMGIFSWLLGFALQYMFIQIGSQTWASLSFVPPGWGSNSSQNRRPCSFCSHKQRCWTVLSELWYEEASNLNTFFQSWKQRTAVKVFENVLQYIKMYAEGVGAKTVKGYFKNVEEQVILLQSKVGAIYSAFKTKKYFLKNNTIGNRLLF